jgi:hypothetical protein
VNPRRPSRAPGGASRGSGGSSSPGDDSPAQTNLGLLLQRALKEAEQAQQVEAAEPDAADNVARGSDDLETKLCANCWNALTFKDERGEMLARCEKDLWVKQTFTLQDLNTHRIRRWYADCPAYDDSE